MPAHTGAENGRALCEAQVAVEIAAYLVTMLGVLYFVARAGSRMEQKSLQSAAREDALCPRCLNVGRARGVCHACGRALPERFMEAVQERDSGSPPAGAKGRPHFGKEHCSGCFALLRDRARPEQVGFCIRCIDCQGELDPEALTRRLIVIGVLLEEDFVRLGESAGVLPPSPRGEGGMAGMRSFTRLEGDRIRGILCLADLPDPPEQLSEHHAATRASVLWVGGDDPAPLALARGIDAYVRRMGWEPHATIWIPVLVEAGELKPHTLAVLRRTFASIRTGVSPASLLSGQWPPLLVGQVAEDAPAAD